jgi:hypothetical protein
MPADGISAAIRLKRRRRHVPSRRAVPDRDYTMPGPTERDLVLASGGTSNSTIPATTMSELGQNRTHDSERLRFKGRNGQEADFNWPIKEARCSLAKLSFRGVWPCSVRNVLLSPPVFAFLGARANLLEPNRLANPTCLVNPDQTTNRMPKTRSGHVQSCHRQQTRGL